MEQAVERSRVWWDASEIVHVFPTSESTLLFMELLEEHKLGRKRILDTMLASTFLSAGVTSLLSLNPSDFDLIGTFTFPK